MIGVFRYRVYHESLASTEIEARSLHSEAKQEGSGGKRASETGRNQERVGESQEAKTGKWVVK